MEASVALNPCPGCAGPRCVTCGLHLPALADGSLCPACVAVEAFYKEQLDEAEMRRITTLIEHQERRDTACPRCSGGRPCADLCEDCSVAEMQDELRHERSHGPGSR